MNIASLVHRVVGASRQGHKVHRPPKAAFLPYAPAAPRRQPWLAATTRWDKRSGVPPTTLRPIYTHGPFTQYPTHQLLKLQSFIQQVLHLAGDGRWVHWEMPMMADTDFRGKSMEWSVTWTPISSAWMSRQKGPCWVTGQSP